MILKSMETKKIIAELFLDVRAEKTNILCLRC